MRRGDDRLDLDTTLDLSEVYSATGEKHRGIIRFVSRQLFFGPCYKMRKYTFLVFCCFGLAGVLIDLDHFIIQETQMLRPLHFPVFVSMWVMCIGYGAYLYRRFHKYSVEEET